MTEQIKTPCPGFSLQRNDIHQVQSIDMIVHTLQRPLKLPQVQYIQKVQQSTEVSQQQYINVDVSAEKQCQNTATHRHCRKLMKHNRFHFLNGVIITS